MAAERGQGDRRARWTAAAGCLAALGYGSLKATWALGGTIGVDDPTLLRPAGTSDGLWLVENMGTVALACLAALILLGLVLRVGPAALQAILTALGWLGTVMVIPGALGLAEVLDHIMGSHLFNGTRLGGIAPATYVFVYACFLTLGLAFPATTFLSRRGRVRGTDKAAVA